MAQPTVPGQSRQDIDPASRTPPVRPKQIDPQQLTQAQDCPFTGKGTITLSRIEVTGATLVPLKEIQSSVADLTGSERDLVVLCEARDRVSALYAARGEALVRVDLPEQRVSGGVLTLKVTEGQISEVTLVNADALGPASGQAAAYVGALKKGRATRWRDVERAFLLTQEIPGAEPGFSIRRAQSGEPNALAAVATFAPRRIVDISFTGHNLGSEDIGRAGGSARVDLNSLTPLAERTSFILSASHNWNQRVFQLIEEAHIGSSGLTVVGDIAYGKTKPEGDVAVLDIEGESLVARIGARYPLVRRRGAAIDVAGRFELIGQDDALGFLKPIGGDEITLFDEDLRVLSLEVGGRWSPAGARDLRFGGSIELRKGLDAFGASDRDDPLLSRPDGRPDFTVVRANASARKDFGASSIIPFVAATLSGQWAPHGLPAYEEFQVGNYTIGRGYDPGAASGDRAVAMQLEAGFEAPLSDAKSVLGTSAVGLFGFYDAARLWNEDPLSYDKSIASLGGGVRFRTRRAQLSLTYAAPQKAALPGGPTPGNRLLLTLTTNFSIR
ncbi:BamA/TamA family outer membrane protein [Sphingomonas sp. NSE70-1]|uniref:BamA/TamA family outer membrane protein n=1 Tax=Sphingomonas caseinilyticus TaxID=2908205 RepID=A0ABT0RWU2_9SPHN|nr:ShlB/FhaC/HecB family hemolysin secretion/activation protein [Sphingomonas caseinilyticus]MCL6699500.1 BamA/TamA family outer membrane protein [Sphingomonas caseinilyticus]